MFQLRCMKDKRRLGREVRGLWWFSPQSVTAHLYNFHLCFAWKNAQGVPDHNNSSLQWRKLKKITPSRKQKRYELCKCMKISRNRTRTMTHHIADWEELWFLLVICDWISLLFCCCKFFNVREQNQCFSYKLSLGWMKEGSRSKCELNLQLHGWTRDLWFLFRQPQASTLLKSQLCWLRSRIPKKKCVSGVT